MSAPLLKITSYDSFKAQVDSTFEALKSAWIAHVKAVNDLKASKTWQAINPSWAEYCKDNLPYAAKTYSAYQAEIPFAELAELLAGSANLTVTTATPNQFRQVRESLTAVCVDERLIAQTLDLAIRGSRMPNPPKSAIEKAYEEVSQLAYNRAIEIDGEDIRAYDALAMNVAEKIREAKLRQKLHIDENAPKEKVTVEIEIDSTGRFVLCVPPEIQDRMPATINLWLPIVSKVGE